MKVIKAILKNSFAQITAMALATVLMFGFVMYEMFNSILIVDPVLEEKLEYVESKGGWEAHKKKIEQWEAEDSKIFP